MSKAFAIDPNNSKNFEWYTPPEIFEALNVEFDLDPCSPGEGKSFVPARKHLTEVEDGLATAWGDDDFVFCNPPYGSKTAVWLEKLAHHPGGGIALVFNRLDTKWFHKIFPKVSAICFLEGRIRFYRGGITPDCQSQSSPGAGSILIAFGGRAVEVLEKSNLGVVMVPFRISR